MHLLLRCAAFLTAVAAHTRWDERGVDTCRFVRGLGLGVASAHAGWALLHADLVRAQPWLLLDLRAGYASLFLPLGLLCTTPWRDPTRRRDFLSSSLGALPAALAVARLGCLATLCCHGPPTDLPWAVPGPSGVLVHPTPLYEALALGVVAAAVTRMPPSRRGVVALAGLAVVRVAAEPWRVPVSLLPVGSLGFTWVLAAAVWNRWIEEEEHGRSDC